MVLPGARADTGEDSLRGALVRPWKLALPAPPIVLRPGSHAAHGRPIVAFLCLFMFGGAAADAADRIILRNLELIADRTVVAVDEDGAQLDAPRAGGGDRVTWDEVEKGRVSADLQPRFDQLKNELGPQLFKLRQRLRIGDYAGLLAPAEDLYPRFAERQSQTAYLVCQSLMWGRLAAGQREQAVEPFLRCVALLSGGHAAPQRLPGQRRMLVSADSPLCGDLPPVWLNRQAAAAALPVVQQLIKDLPMPRPAEAYLYYASLASEAGQFDDAAKVLSALDDSPDGQKQARQIVGAQIEIQRRQPGGAASELVKAAEDGSSKAAALARYWRGVHLLASSDLDAKRDGLLSLLSIPANDGDAPSELAAAALHQSAVALEGMGDAASASSVRREIARRYAATAAGTQSRSAGGAPRSPAAVPTAR